MTDGQSLDKEVDVMANIKKILPMLIFILLPSFLLADNLKDLLVYAMHNNNVILSDIFGQKAMLKNVASAKSSLFPTIHLGGKYTRLDQRSPYRPGDVYTGSITAKYTAYDGSKRKSTIAQQLQQAKSLKFDTLAQKKQLQLTIVKYYYQIKSLAATKKAYEEACKDLKAELQREKKLYKIGMVTYNNVQSMQAALSNDIYQISSTNYQIVRTRKMLSLQIGKNVTKLQSSVIKPPKNIQATPNNTIKALQSSAKALSYQAKSIDSAYKPTVNITDTYSLNGYGRYDAYHPEGQTNQNQLLIDINFLIFDDGAVQQQKDAILLQKSALQYQIVQAKKTQSINVELARLNIQTIKHQIISSKNALMSAQGAYNIVTKKYQVGSVDYVTYLDALSVKTTAESQYKQALNNLQIAYANYYFQTNKNIQEYIK